MYLAKIDIKDIIFHLYLEKWVLHDVGWFRRELGECQASVSCNLQVLEVEESLLIIHSHWKTSLFHFGSQAERRNEVTSKLSGAFFQTTYAFSLYSLCVNISKCLWDDSNSHHSFPHSAPMTWPEPLYPAWHPTSTPAPWESCIVF